MSDKTIIAIILGLMLMVAWAFFGDSREVPEDQGVVASAQVVEER